MRDKYLKKAFSKTIFSPCLACRKHVTGGLTIHIAKKHWLGMKLNIKIVLSLSN